MRYEGALRSPIYDLCRQTVTVYHACYNPFRVTRCVIHGAYFERKTVQTVDKSGGKSCDEFLLVIPNKNARRAAPALFNGIPGVYVLECGDRIQKQRIPLPEGIGIVRLWLPRVMRWLPIWNAILERGLANE